MWLTKDASGCLGIARVLPMSAITSPSSRISQSQPNFSQGLSRDSQDHQRSPKKAQNHFKLKARPDLPQWPRVSLHYYVAFQRSLKIRRFQAKSFSNARHCFESPKFTQFPPSSPKISMGPSRSLDHPGALKIAHDRSGCPGIFQVR